MVSELITLYCVLYDPSSCTVDPERIWGLIRDSGGGCHAGALGQLDFYVPAALISIVLLLDSKLRVNWKKSYI